MKQYLLSVLALLMMAACSLSQKESSKMNVMSFNIRMDTKADSMNQWTFRKDFATNLIKFYDVDILGCQEVLHHQLTDMLDRLPDYEYIGVGRTDGKEEGEYSPIFYKRDRFKLLKNGNFWLAEDMNAVGQKGWDAACERVATWGIFEDMKSGKCFFYLNTHLDHIGKMARHKGALLVLKQTDELSEGLPVLVTGDFNAIPTDDPIKVLTNPDDPRHLIHTRDISPIQYGPEWSFHDFGSLPLEERPWLDYIFVKGDFQIDSHGVLSEMLDTLYPSDHCPVMATITMQ